MTERNMQHAPKPVLISVTPQLFVADLQVSCDFFSGKLGFAIDFVYGEPPFYGQVARDGAQIALRQVDRPVLDGIAAAMKADVDMLAASIAVDHIGRLFQEFTEARTAFHQTLRKESWGARTFIVRDPDGNLLLFAGD